MSFIGQADVNIDKKSRLAIPAKFRSVLEKKNLGPGWVCMPRGAQLWLFPRASFDELSSPWGGSLIPDEDTEKLLNSVFGSAEPVEMDATGRVTLFKKHLAMTGLSGEVTVAGANSHLVIHDRAAWLAEEKERIAQLPALIAKLNARQAHG
ncbi:hypothetical protein MNBD_PLANCTO03-815 [hydrothermal vent metagenome]|uniref:Transcriptional regulator MraZ n=1 Tax=hydrothermal vent metagenome TaxID=652676 RepID=A0A3B1E0Q5_9ZZZZ